MSTLKKGLMMAGASVVALGMFMPGAQAFTDLNWEYELEVDGDVDIDIDIKSKLDPSGLIAVEALQIHLGDATAKSVVIGVTNNAPNGEPVSYTVDLGKVHVAGAGAFGGTWNNTGELVDENGDLIPNYTCGVGGLGGCYLDLGDAVVTIDGIGESLYAPVHLPEVVSTATAVGNNLSIEGPTFTTFDVTQGLTGDRLFDAAEIDADSWVWSIQNASVDSAATAVGNNLSVNLEAAARTRGRSGGDDLIVIGDLTQLSHANVSANSFVADVGVTNYTGLGSDLGRALVSSVATAVGNNGSISVSVGNNN